MTARDDFDRHLSTWLDDRAPVREPELLLGRVLARTARTRRRPVWLIPERWIPMSAITSRLATPSRVPWRTVGLAALLIIVLIVGAILIAGSRQRALPPPFGPAANGELIYSDGGHIYVRDTLAGTSRLLLGGQASDVGVSFSQDGTSVGFLRIVDPLDPNPSVADLWVADADGSNARRIAGPFTDPAWYEWSPDGDAIVMQSTIGGLATTSVVATDGSGTGTIDTQFPALTPTVRPGNDQQILFRGKEQGVQGLYLANRQGGAPVKLALAAGGLGTLDDPNDPRFAVAAWSPDGRQIAYQLISDDGQGLQVRVADIDPSGKVLKEATIGDPSSASEFGPTWLPTGDGLVYDRVVDGTVGLWTVGTAAGSVPRDLHESGPGLEIMGVSPDGTKVISIVGDDRQVMVSDLASGTSTRADFSFDDIVAWQRAALP